MKNSFSQTKIPLLQGKYVDKRVPLCTNILINSYNCIVRRSAHHDHPIENYCDHLFMDDFSFGFVLESSTTNNITRVDEGIIGA